MKSAKILKLLNGCEIQSISQEGVVGIYKEQAYMNGEELELSEKEVNKLYKEYVKNELG